METNEAGWDRGLRIVLGLGLVSLVFMGPHTLWGLVGVIFVATGIWGFCPLYRLVGMRTCAVQPKDTRGLKLNG